MPPDTSISLINLGKRSKSGNTLIKKISNATGVLYEPRQIKRVAKAKAEAARVAAQSEIEITDLQRRAARRWIEEEATKQKNMEDITAKALPQLDENAKPDSMENDWLANFFDKSRIVSDEEMQSLWARVLAGEANAPGTFSKRTVNSIADLDKQEAILFTQLCGFVWQLPGRLTPLVFDHTAKIYNSSGINFETLAHLESIGLIQHSDTGSYVVAGLSKRCRVAYYGRSLALELRKNKDNEIEIGQALLTHIGRELAAICGSKPVEGFWEYVTDKWKNYLPKPASVKRSMPSSDTTDPPSK